MSTLLKNIDEYIIPSEYNYNNSYKDDLFINGRTDVLIAEMLYFPKHSLLN